MDLDGLRRGDMAAMEQCYRRHAARLLAVLYRFSGSREDAEDLVHDVFVGLPHALQHYVERGQFGAWLTRLTIRRAIDRQRRHRWQRPLSDAVEQLPDGAGDIWRDVIAMDRAGRALAALSPALRQVAVLRLMLDLTHPEIAEWLGISVSASEVRWHRAVNQLRQQLEHLR